MVQGRAEALLVGNITQGKGVYQENDEMETGRPAFK